MGTVTQIQIHWSPIDGSYTDINMRDAGKTWHRSLKSLGVMAENLGRGLEDVGEWLAPGTFKKM